MEGAITAGALVIAAVLLTAGAELFAEHAAAAGARLGISGLAVGLLLAGAEPEELVTAVIAALRDQPGVAVGDAVGANVTLLTLVLGSLTLAASPLTLGRRSARYALAAAGSGALAWVVLTDGLVTRGEGALLLVAYLVVVALIWWWEREVPAIGELAEVREDAVAQGRAGSWGLVLVLVGIVLMASGGRMAVFGAERVIEQLGVEGSVVGLTLVALATTSEFVSLIPAATRRGIPELASAGIIGSVIYNATVTLGAAAVSRALPVTGVVASAIVAAAVAALVAALAWTRAGVGRPFGIALLGGYGMYMWLLWR